MIVCKEWSFNEIVNNIERLKEEYIFFLAFFSLDDKMIRVRNQYIKWVRDKFYDMNIKEWQKDVCWEYMNGYICFPDLIYHVHKLDKKIKR